MATEQTYKGSCHCGKVSYEVKAELEQVIACNCSICSKKGHLLTFVAPEKFSLLSGDARLTDYQFHKMNIHHLFCPTCGVQSFMRGKKRDGSAIVAINVRCLEGVDPGGLKVTQVDGRSSSRLRQPGRSATSQSRNVRAARPSR
jgi:hypothetical protein